MKQNKDQQRQYYLDWLRVFATGAVFILHCAHIFDEVPYHIKNGETSRLLGALVLFLNYWIMPLFFFIAGGASHFSLSTRNGKAYIKERIQRLIIPFIAGSILFTLLQNYAEALNHRVFSGSFLSFLKYEFNYCIIYIETGKLTFSPRIFGILGHHLWFLMFLFIYSLITFPLFRLMTKGRNNHEDSAVSGREVNRRLYIGPLILFAISSILSPIDPEYEGWSTFFQWGLFFTMGFFILSNAKAVKTIKLRWKIHLISGTVSFICSAILLIRSNLTFFSGPSISGTFVLYSLCAAVTSWSWTFALIGIAGNKLNSTNTMLPQLSRGAMPFYILHQPVILLLALFIVNWHAGIAVKLIAIFFSALVCTSLIVSVLILPSCRISFLFGIKGKRKEKKELDFTDIIR